MTGLKLRPPSVEVSDTGTAKGRGAYAMHPLKPGDHVETCPVIIFLAKDYDALPKALRERLFNWSTLITRQPGEYALALGYGSIYNHANPANLRYSAMRTTSTLTFVAARAIETGEELTINYDERGGFDPRPGSAWMKRHDVDPA